MDGKRRRNEKARTRREREEGREQVGERKGTREKKQCGGGDSREKSEKKQLEKVVRWKERERERG